MSIAYLLSWEGTAKPVNFQIQSFSSRVDAVSAGVILEHDSLGHTAKAVDSIADLEGVGSSFLLALYNAITGESQKSFHDSSTGRRKVWEALTTKYPDPNPVQAGQAEVSQPEGETTEKASAEIEEGKTTMATKKATKAVKAKKVKGAPKEKKGPGVIDTIVTLLEGKGGTIAQLAEKLAAKFPEKTPDGLKATLKIQVNRLKKSKDEGGRNLKIKTEKTEGSNELHYYV